MFTLLTENIGTILTGLVLLGIIAAIILKIRRDRKKGVCAGCNCASNCNLPDCKDE